MIKKLWVEKYRPRILDEYIFPDLYTENIFRQMVKEETIPHLLLSGIQGSGKTTLAQVLIHELHIEDSDVLRINASDENSVDVIREKIKTFINTFAISSFKVILLEEADYLTINSQAILRVLMEEYSDNARFILTCNYENKIIPAIRSRCQHFRFKTSDKEGILEYVVTILLNEKIKFTERIIQRYVEIGYPDIRKIVNLIQQNSTSGTLLNFDNTINKENADYQIILLDLLEKGSWEQIRTLVCNNVSGEEWEELYRFLYINLETVFTDRTKWEQAIIVIAEHLFRHALSSDPEINFSSCIIQLSQI